MFPDPFINKSTELSLICCVQNVLNVAKSKMFFILWQIVKYQRSTDDLAVLTLPNDKILDFSKLKAFADDKKNIT